jgi:DNA-binding transcriptional MocR family regulator
LLDVNIDREDASPLHEQVAAEIRRSIAEGDAKPGDRLPPARHLAAVMGVNTNTVSLRCERYAAKVWSKWLRAVGSRSSVPPCKARYVARSSN